MAYYKPTEFTVKTYDKNEAKTLVLAEDMREAIEGFKAYFDNNFSGDGLKVGELRVLEEVKEGFLSHFKEFLPCDGGLIVNGQKGE